MMDPVADDEQPQRDQPGPPPATPGGPRPGGPPPSPTPGGPGQPPVVPGDSFDAEQWQRFQRFQEFQQFEEAQRRGDLPPPAPPPPRKPPWRKVLMSKWLRRAVALLLLLIAANWAFDHYFGDPEAGLPASKTGGFKTERNVIHAQSPGEGILLFYVGVGGGNADVVCRRFESELLADTFGDHFNAPSCQVAVQQLAEQVTDRSEFTRPLPGKADFTPRPDGSVVVSSCDLDIRGGPRLGEFTFRIIPGSRSDQWIITDHRKEAAGCR